MPINSFLDEPYTTVCFGIYRWKNLQLSTTNGMPSSNSNIVLGPCRTRSCWTWCMPSASKMRNLASAFKWETHISIYNVPWYKYNVPWYIRWTGQQGKTGVCIYIYTKIECFVKWYPMHAHLQGSTGFDIPLQDFHRSSKSARELVQDHWGWVDYVYTCMVLFLNGSMAKKNTQVFQESCTLSLYWFERRFQEYILKFAYIWIANFNASTAPSLIFEYIYTQKTHINAGWNYANYADSSIYISGVFGSGTFSIPTPEDFEGIFWAPLSCSRRSQSQPSAIATPRLSAQQVWWTNWIWSYWWTKEVGDCEYLSPVFGSLPVFLGTCEEGNIFWFWRWIPSISGSPSWKQGLGFWKYITVHIMLTWSNAPCFYIYNWLYLYHPCIYQRHVLITSYILHGIYQSPLFGVIYGNPFNI